MRLYLSDMRRAGICKAARRLFFEPNNLDWKDFVKNGIDSETLLATGDSRDQIERVIRIAEEARCGRQE